ncbi:Hypothetical predicted protein [Cloeon dipterum]|uniref:Bee-milk protein n=1 Tax=Cloeon dipterum TaxID=197152 RepID=A0A8S1D995_9INSE|nr:Hypothetical predicted protein [Cloeon dipterum]
MNPFVIVIVLLHLSLATTVNFTQVFEWPDGMDYEWPSEESRTNALKDGTFKPEKIAPRFMAVYKTRIFLSLYKFSNIPVTLVSLPTSSASSASPKLTPFPSWNMHGERDCSKIQAARGLEVDSIGRLWVLDSGSENCNAKLWTIDLVNADHTKLIHRFSFRGWVNDLVLDQTPSSGTFAYISREDEQNIVVFSLEGNESRAVETLGVRAYSIALSPKKEPRHLYLSNFESSELYSMSVAALRNGTRTANPKLIGNWTGNHSYRMLMDNQGTIYAALWWINYISSWNTFQQFEEQRFQEDGKLDASWPFTFSLDSMGTFWMTELNETASKPKYRLLKAAVGAKSYMCEPPKTGIRNFDYSALIACLLLGLERRYHPVVNPEDEKIKKFQRAAQRWFRGNGNALSRHLFHRK